MALDYEKLGLFYLGKRYDLASGTRQPDPVLYDSKDLVTHAVCVGMTGSGKTGLGIGLIEEAAIDGIPVLAIDPKGDLTNLLLTFPALAASDFRPWVDASDAAARGLSPDQLAGEQAASWAKGLAEWEQSGDRIAALKRAAAVRVFTPGSRAGTPLALLRSLRGAGDENEEDARARVTSTAASLLALAGFAELGPHDRELTFVSAILTSAAAARARRICRGWCSRSSVPPSIAWACWTWKRSTRPRIGRRWRCGSTACWPRRASTSGWTARRSTSARCCTTPRASPGLQSCRLPTWATPSGCWSCRCC